MQKDAHNLWLLYVLRALQREIIALRQVLCENNWQKKQLTLKSLTEYQDASGHFCKGLT